MTGREAMHPFLTEEEVTLIKDDLARRRRPRSYEPGKWMVSAYNRDSKAIGMALPDAFPKSVIVRDITLRTAPRASDIVLTKEERMSLGAALMEAGVPSVEITSLAHGVTFEDIREEIEALKEINPDVEINMGGLQTEEGLNIAVTAGVTLTGFEQPAVPAGTLLNWSEPARLAWEGKDWRKVLQIPTTVDAQIETGIALIQMIKSTGMRVSAGISMLPYADDEYLEKYCGAMDRAGADQISLSDGPSGLGPEAWRYVVSLVKKAAPHCKIGVHAHNNFGLAVAGTLASVHAGADIVEVSVNSLSAASGQADLAQVVASLTMLYGVETGIKLEKMVYLARLTADITRVPVESHRPITGEQVFNWAAIGNRVLELKVDPLFHSSIEPSIVGNNTKWSIGMQGGTWAMLEKLQELGVAIDRSLVPSVIREVRKQIRVRRRGITDEEIAEIALRVKTESS